MNPEDRATQEATGQAYVVTTLLACSPPEAGHDVSRRAVATLDEARTIGREAIERSIGTKGWFGAPVHAQYEDLPESGGTITVPDGTVIEVERWSWEDLALEEAAEGWTDRVGAFPSQVEFQAAVLAAFNSREEARP